MTMHLLRRDRLWQPRAASRLAPSPSRAWPVAVILFALTLVSCSDRQALLLVVSAVDPVESFDLKVRSLDTGELVLVTAGEKVTTPEDPNRDISAPGQALKVAIEFDKEGDYLLHLVGRVGQGSDRLMVALRHFRVSGTHEHKVRLIPLEHDQDGDRFPACGSYGDCSEYEQSLSCEYLDCNDANPLINPLAEQEICGNGQDEDCSARCSGGGGSAGDAPCIDADGDGSPDGEDCDDQDPCRVPGLVEAKNLCQLTVGDFPALPAACQAKLHDAGQIAEPPFCGDGVDQDCSGQDLACEIDEDCDGSPASVDCADNDPAIHPGAPEKCDGVDNNCDRVVDEGCIPCDADGDGYALDGVQDPSCTVPKGECDDYDAGIHPGTTAGSGGSEGGMAAMALRGYCRSTPEKNGTAGRDVDHDCDGAVARDDGCPPADCDSDGDGFSAATCVPAPPRNLEDCNPNDPTVYPGAPDKCGDGVAQNCVADQPCDADRDGDGYVAPADCSDNTADPRAAEIHPWATEVCDGIDNDCDGLVDEGNPDHEGSLIGTSQPSCSDHAHGECSPCPGGAATCASAERRTTGICVCSHQKPVRDPQYALDGSARVTCSGEDEEAVASQRCFGANQPQAEECDPRDWDCDGEADDPDGSNLADALAQRTCGNDEGTCRSGVVVGCDLSRSLPHVALLPPGTNEHWICSSETVLPIPELCNGRDDNCDGCDGLDDDCGGAEDDPDNDHYLACGGCRDGQVSGIYALRADLAGCDDCEPNAGAIHPNADEQCNAVDDNCSRSASDPLGLADDGAYECREATLNCCTDQRACRNLSNDTSNCGRCGQACNLDAANRCLNGNCVCGDTGAACPSDLNCVNGQCRCVANGRCGGCCDGNTCRASTRDHCGVRGASCEACSDGNSCTTDSCQVGSCVNSAVNRGTSCDGGTGRCTDGSSPTCCKGCLDGGWDCQTGNTTTNCGSGGERCDGCTAPECQTAVCNTSGTCATSPRSGGCTDDGYDCTSDVCSGGTCTHPVDSGHCLIDSTCHREDDTRSGNVCEICSSANDTAWSPNNGASCAGPPTMGCLSYKCDGTSCESDGYTGVGCLDSSGDCQPGTEITACGQNKPCERCDDGNPCTEDSCVDYGCENTLLPEGTECPTGGTTGACDDSGNCCACVRDGNCVAVPNKDDCGVDGGPCRTCQGNQTCDLSSGNCG